MDLQDRAVIVTGAGRGIGRALSVAFAREGARVALCARTAAELRETAAIIEREGGRCLEIPADVSDPGQVERMVGEASGRFGRVDLLFNNAARIPVINALWETDPEAWWEEIAVNLRGPMLCSRAVLPGMIERNEGIVINMSGGQNIPGRTSYCCSKAALGRLTALVARELEAVGSKVIVFGMTPGLVKTRRTLREAESSEGLRWNPETRRQFDVGKDRPPEDCARLTIDLVKRADPAMNGQLFSVQ